MIFGQAFDTTNTNDLMNRTYASIWFSNTTWRLVGNPITLTAGLTNTVAGSQGILFGLTNAVAQNWHNNVSAQTVTLQASSYLVLNAGLGLTGPGNFTIFGPITGSGALTSSLRLASAANVAFLQLTNAGNTFSGGLVIDDSNRVEVTRYGSAGTGGIVVTNGGQLWLNSATNLAPVYLADRGFVESAGVLGALRIDSDALQRGPVFVVTNTRITVWSGTSLIDGPIIGTHDIEKTGTGNLQLVNTANLGFTGKWIVMSNGYLNAAADQSFGAVPAVPVADYFTLTNRARLMNFNNELVVHPNRGIYIPAGAGATDTGGGLEAGWWAGLQVLGVISGRGALFIVSNATPGWIVLAGANTFQGGLTNDARLRLGADEVIPHGAAAGDVALLPQVVYPVHSTNPQRAFDLAGYTETINGLFGGGVITNSAGAAELWIGANDASGVYTGRVAAGPGAALRIVKTGAGVQTMMGGFHGDVSLQAVGGGVLVVTGTVAGAGAAGAALSAGDIAAAGVLSTPGVMAFTNGAVVLNPGGSNPGVDGDLFAAGDLVFDTAAFVHVTPLRALGAGAVPAFSYTNSLTGSAALLTLVPTNTRYTAFVADDTTPGVITISAAGGAPNVLTWVRTNGT